MKTRKYLLLISLLFFPLFVMAEEDSSIVWMAYIWEMFSSIHSTVFLLNPLSGFLKSKGYENWTVGKLFLARALILIVITPFFPWIFLVDFFTMFIGPFFEIRTNNRTNDVQTPTIGTASLGKITCPKCGRVMAVGNTRCVQCGTDLKGVASLKCAHCETLNLPTARFCKECGKELIVDFTSQTKLQTPVQCPNCNATLLEQAKFCKYCGTSVESLMPKTPAPVMNISAAAGTPINKTDFESYLLSGTEKIATLKIIEKELSSDPANKGKTLPSIERKKVLATLIYVIITFILISIYMAYHTYLGLGIVLWIVSTIIYVNMTKNYNIKKYILKEAMNRPDEKISYIASSILSGATTSKALSLVFQIGLIFLLIGGTLTLYSKPHMIFERQKEGYSVRYYTYGFFSYDEEITVPETHKGKPVTGIRGDTFKNVYFVKKVNLPDTITEIRGGAFQGCSLLKEINLPPKITEIHGSTFEDCYSLEEIKIPSGVTRIGGSAFRNCSNLKSAEIPETVSEIGSSAFRNTALTSVCISEDTYVNERAFKETYPSIYYYEEGCKPTYSEGEGYYSGY